MQHIKTSIQELSLLDDIFFSFSMDGEIACMQEIIRTLTEENLTVAKVSVQDSIASLKGKNVRLDALCETTAGDLINIEIQNIADEAPPRRARFYASMLDEKVSRRGVDYKDLPRTIVIFICKKDPFAQDCSKYVIERTFQHSRQKFGDGSTIIYINCEKEDNSPLGKLIHDLKSSDPEKMFSSTLANRVKFCKTDKKVVKQMSEIIDNLIAAESAKAFAEGEAVGEARGEARGETKGNTRTLTLVKILYDNKRFADIEKLINDKDADFQEQLKKEFNI